MAVAAFACFGAYHERWHWDSSYIAKNTEHRNETHQRLRRRPSPAGRRKIHEVGHLFPHLVEAPFSKNTGKKLRLARIIVRRWGGGGARSWYSTGDSPRIRKGFRPRRGPTRKFTNYKTRRERFFARFSTTEKRPAATSTRSRLVYAKNSFWTFHRL